MSLKKLLDCCKKKFSKAIVCLPIMILGLNYLKIKLKNEKFNPSFLSFKYQQLTVNSQLTVNYFQTISGETCIAGCGWNWNSE